MKVNTNLSKNILYLRGAELSASGKYEEAIVAYGKAIKIDPDYGEALYMRAFAYGETEEHAKAIDGYTNVLALNPQHKYALYRRGLAHASLKMYKEALLDYGNAMELGLDNVVPFIKSAKEAMLNEKKNTDGDS